jgi:hypothetical protein
VEQRLIHGGVEVNVHWFGKLCLDVLSARTIDRERAGRHRDEGGVGDWALSGPAASASTGLVSVKPFCQSWENCTAANCVTASGFNIEDLMRHYLRSARVIQDS